MKELLDYRARIAGCGNIPDTIQGFLLQSLGAMYYDLDDFTNAIHLTQQSIFVLGPGAQQAPENRDYLLTSYFNLSVFYEYLNDRRGKTMAVDSCIAIGSTGKPIAESYLMALIKKVGGLFNAGDYAFSFNYATIGEQASRAYTERNRIAYLMYFFLMKIQILIINKEYDLAERQLLSISKNAVQNGASEYLGTLYEQLADITIHKGQSEHTLHYIEQALLYDRRAGNNTGCMQILNNLGYYFYAEHFKNDEKALQSFRAALRYGSKNPSGKAERWESLNILGNIAGVYVRKGLYDSAFYCFQQAFDKLKPGINERIVLDSLDAPFLKDGNAKYLAELVIEKADAFMERYKNSRHFSDLGESIRIYKLADRLLDKIKTNHIELESTLTWRQNSRRLYEHAIKACYQANLPDEAFYFFEKSRAVLLGSQLAEQRWVSEQDLLTEAQLKKNILNKENSLKTLNNTGAAYTQELNTILDNKARLFDWQQEIKIRNPVYYQQFIDSNFISLADVQHKVLNNHTALIEMYTGDSAVYAMIIRNHKTVIRQINKAAFDSTANLYVRYLSNAGLLNTGFEAYKKTARCLYQLIFNNDSLTEDRVIISPEGRYFPFESLVTSPEGDALNYFLQQHAVSYTYSSRYLLTQFNTVSATGTRDFLGVAPVSYQTSWNLATLQDCDRSLKTIRHHFRDTDLQLFGAATKGGFLKNFTHFKIIQLYTHASDSSSAGEPVIYFADSILYLSELIGGLRPATQLIVLSACNTGSGKLNTGEGVFSFNRGFAGLGIPASVSSLWTVDKVADIQITESFYQYLSEGWPTDIALQKAKLAFLQNASKMHELPYYWAGTILAGKSAAIEFNKPRPWRFLAVIPAIGLIFLLAYYKRKRPVD